MPSSEYYFDEEMAFEFGRRRPHEVVCKFCGKPGLRWHPYQQQTLIDAKGAIHYCGGPASPDEFDVVED